MYMNCKNIEVQLKNDGMPYMFKEANLYLEDNILCVECLDGFTYCFPIENIWKYLFKRKEIK